jgi:hypothetical protein
LHLGRYSRDDARIDSAKAFRCVQVTAIISHRPSLIPTPVFSGLS